MQSKFLSVVLLIPILVFGFGFKVWAQYTTGTIAGTVTDSTGAALAGVTVTLKSQGTNETRTYTTSDTGAYTFPALPPGSYDLTLSASGFDQVKAVVNATSSQTVTQNFSLKPGSASTTIEVDASASVLNTTGAELATTHSTAELKYLPSAT